MAVIDTENGSRIVIDPQPEKTLRVRNEISFMRGEKGEKGEPGYTPQRGTDYWTEDDRRPIEEATQNANLAAEAFYGIVDASLSQQGKAADAKATGDALAVKADIDGYYPEMRSGLSDNLAGTDSVAAEFIYRSTGGDADVSDGMATITAVYGNSTVDGSLKNMTGTGIKTVGFNLFDSDILLQASGWVKNGRAYRGYLSALTGVFAGSNFLPVKLPSGQQIELSLNYNFLSSYTSGVHLAISLHYSDGTEQWVNASSKQGHLSGQSNANKTLLGIKMRYGQNGQIELSDFCIHLVWSGKRNGEYEEHWSETKALPINAYFAGGMRSAGETRDELRADKAILRVGTRSFQTGDSTDPSVTTDGVTTNYPLDEPIETEISPALNLSYRVSDFGTEELTGEAESAPIRLEVVYNLNAVDTLRRLPQTYIGKASMDDFTSALGAAIGKTIRAVWDADNNRWHYTVN